jgi:hypothetical protein
MGYIGMDEGNIKMNPDDKTSVGTGKDSTWYSNHL